MISKDNLVTLWIVLGFVSLIALMIENSLDTWLAYGLLTLTIGSFALALYFTDLRESKKEKKT